MVKEVDDTKILLRMVLMSMTFFLYGAVRSIGNTFYMQGSGMDSKTWPHQEFSSSSFDVIACYSWIC